MSMQPFVADYMGHRFRSFLEADWAITLESLGIKWEYEPRTVTLPSGQLYVPDFWLPEIGTWLEVKGDDVGRVEKPREWAEAVACHCSGACSCRWPGGEVVVIGRPASRSAGKRFGTARWEDARWSCLLSECSECGRSSWIRPRQSFQCRACGHQPAVSQARLRGAGEIDFHRLRRDQGTGEFS